MAAHSRVRRQRGIGVEGESARGREANGRVGRRNVGYRREEKRSATWRVAGAATSRAPQCLSVLRMDITFDETDSPAGIGIRI